MVRRQNDEMEPQNGTGCGKRRLNRDESVSWEKGAEVMMTATIKRDREESSEEREQRNSQCESPAIHRRTR